MVIGALGWVISTQLQSIHLHCNLLVLGEAGVLAPPNMQVDCFLLQVSLFSAVNTAVLLVS